MNGSNVFAKLAPPGTHFQRPQHPVAAGAACVRLRSSRKTMPTVFDLEMYDRVEVLRGP
jgi:hypothetical protein